MPFPEDRFIRAGADQVQLAALTELYDSLPEAGQESFDARVASVSDAQIAADYLSEPVDEAVSEVEEEPEPEVTASSPWTASPSAAADGEAE